MKPYLDFSEHSMETFWQEWLNLDTIYVENLCSLGKQGDEAFAKLMNKYRYCGSRDWETSYSGISSKTLGTFNYTHSSAEVYIPSYIELVTMLNTIQTKCQERGKKFTYTINRKGFGVVIVDTNCFELNNLFPADGCALNSTCTSMRAIEAFKFGIEFIV